MDTAISLYRKFFAGDFIRYAHNNGFTPREMEEMPQNEKDVLWEMFATDAEWN